MAEDVQNHSLFPIKLKIVSPANTGSADCKRFGEGENGIEYVIKEPLPGQELIPASEYLCCELARYCAIAVPNYEVGELPDGSSVFLSEWLAGQQDRNVVEPIFKNRFAEYEEMLCRIFVFDLFIHNVDRHFGNYFFHEGRGGIKVRAFDHSRALLCHGWPLPNVPLPDGCNTMRVARATPILSAVSKCDNSVVLNGLSQVKDEQVAQMLKKIPDQWIPSNIRDSMLQDWNVSSENRISAIEQYINGITTP